MRLFFLAILFGFLGTAIAQETNQSNGFCSFDYASPSLPKASCQIPQCPQGVNCECPGGDCEAPSVGQGSVNFQEPVLLWNERCVLGGKRSPCYELTSPFSFRVSAQDASGISEIGFELAIDSGDRRTFAKLWGTPSKGPSGDYELHSSVRMLAPPGQKIDYSVLKLCAKDKEGNQGCTLVH